MTKRRILIVLPVIMVCLLFMEGLLRLTGSRPFPYMNVEEKVEPSDYAGYHTVYGYCLIPGSYDITVGNKLKFHVTHDADSFRITRLQKDSANYTGKPGVHIYGCSFTWGEGINDSSTFPFLVQTAMPQYNVRNRGLSAAGEIQAYLQLKEEIRKGQQPKIAILSYASFHNERNTFNRAWATQIKQFLINKSKTEFRGAELKSKLDYLDSIRFPQARSMNDSLQVLYKPMNGDLFPFSRYSALCNAVNNVLIRLDEKKINSNDVTRKIFYELNVMCKKNGIRLIIACLDDDDLTKNMQQYFKEHGIEWFGYGVNYQDNNYNLYPYDLHPNEKANAIYAKKILDYLAMHP